MKKRLFILKVADSSEKKKSQAHTNKSIKLL